MIIPQFVHPAFHEHLSGFHFGIIMNNGARNSLFMFFVLYVPDFLLGSSGIDSSERMCIFNYSQCS